MENDANTCKISESSSASDEKNCKRNKKKLPRSEKKKIKRLQVIAAKRARRKEKKLEKKERSMKSTETNQERNIVTSVIKSEFSDGDKLNISTSKTSPTTTEEKKRKIEDAENEAEHISKKIRLERIKQRCREAMVSGLKVCIDCNLENYMSKKECSKLAQQIARLYGSNRKSEKPVHIYLTGLDKKGEVYKECLQKNSGFENYLLDITSETVDCHFNDCSDQIMYLSPDSENVMEVLDPNKIYVIGGLVDESIKNNITYKEADKKGITTARLPIDKYMDKLHDKSTNYSYNKILSVNQVFDILLTLNETAGNWKKAFELAVPKRKGFVVKDQTL